MQKFIKQLHSPLFNGIGQAELEPLLQCTGYHIATFQKDEIISFEGEHLLHIGIILSGVVDMVKEDVWGNRTVLLRMKEQELFGETFACGANTRSAVTFTVVHKATVLFLPFERILHTCKLTCVNHHKMVENMVSIIAQKNRDLMQKVEIISKRTLREKIMAYLSVQAERQSSRYFEIPLGRVELAEYLCADRSALTRELSKMKMEGLIDYDRNIFRIL